MMDENTDGQMEADVSSTTQDVPLTETRRMEVTVEVAETSDDEDMNFNTSSPANSSPCKIASPVKKVATPVKESPTKESPTKNKIQESPQKLLDEEPQPSTATTTPVKDTPKGNPDITTSQSPTITPAPQLKVYISPKSNIQSHTDKSIVNSHQKVKVVPLPEIIQKDNNDTDKVQTESAGSKLISPITDTPLIEISTTENSNNHNISTIDKKKVDEQQIIDIPGKPSDVLECSKDEKPEKNKEDIAISIVSSNDDASNDSQQSGLDKGEGKNISRELKSLINSAKESKIISECTQITTKIRKSRAHEGSSGSINTSLDAEKLQIRRASDVSQKSNCSEKSDRTAKRSMRSQNPEFVTKNKIFLSSLTGKNDASLTHEDESVEDTKVVQPAFSTPKKQKSNDNKTKNADDKAVAPKVPSENNKLSSDPFCWRCHWAVEQIPSDKGHVPFHCNVCPRTYHYKCLTVPERAKISEKDVACPECMLILQAESSETRSQAMKKINVAMLSEMLKYAWQRMTEVNGVEPFMAPVDRTTFPEYDKYVVHPMDLNMMKENIDAGRYGSTEAFASDAQWILHNSIIFNTPQSKLTASARSIVRTCRTEMVEVEACPECYLAAHARRPTWFTDVCTTPHILLWAKLKGFPYWPAKGMSVNNSEQVDVRFFGAHDRAWVPAKDCYLYSEKDPNNFRTKRQDLINCTQEAEQYIRNLTRKFGKFEYPQFRVALNPVKMAEQLKMMIPGYQGDSPRVLVKDKSVSNTPSPASTKVTSRSRSKSSKESSVDVDSSDVEVVVASKKRKITENNLTTQVDDQTNKKDKTKNEGGKKRRRSELEEAVITIMEDVPTKRKRLASVEMVVLEKSTNNDSTMKTDEEKPKEKQEKNTKAPTQSKDPKTQTQNKDLKLHSPLKDKDTRSPRSSSIKKSSTPKIVFKIVKKSSSGKSQKSKHKIRSSLDKNGVKITRSDKIKKDETKKGEDKNTTATNSREKKNDSDKTVELNKSANKNTSSPKPKSLKDRIIFDDDDTSLASIAKKGFQDTVIQKKVPGLPTISNVISLSTTKSTQSSKNTSKEVTNFVSSVLTQRKDKTMVDPKQTEKPIGRLGVKAFARMTQSEKDEADKVQVKTEPLEPDDPERQSAKIEMLNTFHLRPVNHQSSLREIRINKVTSAPVPSSSRKPDPKPRAKKSFPQPPKPDDRSGLTSKNSMVYIPIQPPMTQAPVKPPGRLQQPPNPGISSPPALRASTSNSMVNTLTTPVMTVVSMPSPAMTNTTSIANMSQMATLSQLTSGQVGLGQMANMGPVPSSVHTVPLITSLNGQWTFSLQPMMSVGGVEGGPSSSPLVNGVGERTAPPGLAPISNAAVITPVQTTPRTATGDATSPADMPRLVQKPPNPLDVNSVMGEVPPPMPAGPVTGLILQHSVKLVEYFRQLLVDSLSKTEDPAALVTSLKLQIEQLQWKHKQELDELRHNHELMLSEMRMAMEKDRHLCITEARRTFQTELDAAIKATKSKQWCAFCHKEAQFYCCWNTSYCDYPCQRAHWAQHCGECTQQKAPGSEDSSNVSTPNKLSDSVTLQKTPTNNSGKLVPAPKVFRAVQSTSSQGKSPIVVSIDDKIVSRSPQQPTPNSMIINKQHEDSTNKKVSSGGYLIVGASNVTSPSVVIN